MLTPAEAIGLRGKAIDGRLRRAVARISATRLSRLADRLREDAWKNHIIYDRDGASEPVRIMLRPLAATHDQLVYVHHVCSVMTDALRRVTDLCREDAEVRALFALDPAEERWFRELWTRGASRHNPIYGRLDAVCDFSSASWRDTLAFLEPNLSGVGGIHYAPVIEQLVMRDLVPEIRRQDRGLHLELPRDQRELFIQALIEHGEAIGRPLKTLAFVEPKYEQSGPDEQRSLAQFIQEKYGIEVVHLDPHELSISGSEVMGEGRVVDLAYRDYELPDLLALERESSQAIEPMRRLFRENRMVSSLAGDLDHKSGFELLTDPVLVARHFSPEERKVFESHVLWTRILSHRTTTSWDGTEVDLVAFAHAHRESLVLKPNRGFGGRGVYLGASTAEEEWSRLLDEALAGAADPHQQSVLQRSAPLPVFEFPTLTDEGSITEEPFYTVMGFTPTDHGLGVICRVSQKQVVNVAKRGGIAALLVARDIEPAQEERSSRIRTGGALETFRSRVSTLRDLEATIGLLGWDEETYLPELAHAQRGEQLATLEAARHALLLDAELFDVASELAQTRPEDARVQREVSLLLRQHRIARALPGSLVKAFARARSRTLLAWEEARAKDDYHHFLYPFSELLGLVRERGQAMSLNGEAYDGLLDEYEPGLTRARLEPMLMLLARELAPIIEAAKSRTPASSVHGGQSFSVEAQRSLAEALLRSMGFDFRRGRLDVSSHPFTLIAGTHDVRMTLRFDPSDFTSALFAALHEGGHGLYDQGFGPDLAGTLLADSPSTSLHEAQARLWENHVGRSASFWRGFLPVAQRCLGSALEGVDAEALCQSVNVVRPSLQRVGADELTYSLHIVLRSELEWALLTEDLLPADLPAAWRERSRRYLGIEPSTDVEGCLQDVHWALGSLGYFPSYTLGDLYAAMFWERLEQDLPNVHEALSQGDLQTVTSWLRRWLHTPGSERDAASTVSALTGQALSTKSFLDYARRKFSC